MLGRRAAVGLSIAVLAGGGTAFAATHGSSPSTKPQVQKDKVMRQNVVTKTKAKTHTGHHCPFSGNASAQL